MKRGIIVLLNGVSSSGKSSLAREFIKLRPDFFHVSADDFANWINSMEDIQSKRIIPVETEHYFHRTIAMLSDTGVNVIVDHILHNEYTARDCSTVLNDYPLLFVGVHCPINELARRERGRGDRREGQAREQLSFVHVNDAYDLEVNTYDTSLKECARIISEAVEAVGTL